MSSTLSDGTPLPRGQLCMRNPAPGYDMFMGLVSNMLLDPTNSVLGGTKRLLYPIPVDSNWKDPLKLSGQIHTVLQHVSYIVGPEWL